MSTHTPTSTGISNILSTRIIPASPIIVTMEATIPSTLPPQYDGPAPLVETTNAPCCPSQAYTKEQPQSGSAPAPAQGQFQTKLQAQPIPNQPVQCQPQAQSQPRPQPKIKVQTQSTPIPLQRFHSRNEANVVPLQSLGKVPRIVHCPVCQEIDTTVTKQKIGGASLMVMGILIFIGCVPCLWIPLVIRGLKDIEHYCSNCDSRLASYKKIGGLKLRVDVPAPTADAANTV
ncbi:LITAF-like zinc ribbon domain-containing protein [Halenospora varia]|nr:LITAF-like zinc ribbon domain-containing protein [Halenospora varia]